MSKPSLQAENQLIMLYFDIKMTHWQCAKNYAVFIDLSS